MPRQFAVAVSLLLAFACHALPVHAQTAPAAKPAPVLARWIDLQNATLNVRYRLADASTGTVITNQLQHRESLRARLKFDRPGKYALNIGAFSGARFVSGWNNTGLVRGDWADTLAVRALYVAAQPIAGVEGQYGGLYIIKGESTEITTYDEDGYVIGERVTLRRPQNLFLDEISVTVGYLTSDAAELGISRRVKYLDDTPNYVHVLVDKKLGARAGISTDYTSIDDADVWRAAATVRLRELRIIDGIAVETYKRFTENPNYGFAVSADKVLSRRVNVNGGYAQIDPRYGGLNGDRFVIGKRVFFTANYVLSPRFTTSAFASVAVGENVPLPQRNVMTLVFTYNVVPDLRRTGLF